MQMKLHLMSVKQNLLSLTHLQRQLDHALKIKFNGTKLYQTDSFIYLGIHLDKYLTWKHQTNNAAIKKTLWPLFMDGVQLPQGYSHFKEAVYIIPLSSQKFLVLILSTWEGWKVESTLEKPNGFKHGTPGLGIQHLNH